MPQKLIVIVAFYKSEKYHFSTHYLDTAQSTGNVDFAHWCFKIIQKAFAFLNILKII
jgi:hypothetical protein